MATVDLDIWTDAYPTIANKIQIRVYKQSDPLAIIASLDDTVPGHPFRSWSFPGLPRTNLLFRIFELGPGDIVVQQLGNNMNVVPPSSGNLAHKNTEQIEADVTTGFVSGVNTVTFDGSGGSADWRGWDIATLDRMGVAPMKKGTEYTWAPVTGILALVQPGDKFGPNEWFNVDFEDKIVAGDGNDNPTFIIKAKIITTDYNVNAGTDFGTLIIIDPALEYLEITFPDIDTVVEGVPIDFEFRRQPHVKTAKFKTQSGQIIDWLEGARPDLYICHTESISFYKFIDPSGPTSMWRVYKPFGNWGQVGQIVWSDNIAGNMFNRIPLIGTSNLDVFQYARLYNDFVVPLGSSGQITDYDIWATPTTNKTKFTLANSLNPIHANQFLAPDMQNLYLRNSDGAILPGVKQDAQVGAFGLKVNGFRMQKSGTNNHVVVLANEDDAILSPPNSLVDLGTINAGKENRVASRISRAYLIV